MGWSWLAARVYGRLWVELRSSSGMIKTALPICHAWRSRPGVTLLSGPYPHYALASSAGWEAIAACEAETSRGGGGRRASEAPSRRTALARVREHCRERVSGQADEASLSV